MVPSANRLPAPGWHLPQVAGRFFTLTMDLGSSEGRMLCTPWQLAQLATVCDPPFEARPWKEASNVVMRSEGRPKRRDRFTFPWHCPHVSRTWSRLTEEAVFPGRRMECSPWQSVQT